MDLLHALIEMKSLWFVGGIVYGRIWDLDGVRWGLMRLSLVLFLVGAITYSTATGA